MPWAGSPPAKKNLGEAVPGIESRPGVCGGEPCIVRTRIPVWLLENARRQGVTEQGLLAAYGHARPLIHGFLSEKCNGSRSPLSPWSCGVMGI